MNVPKRQKESLILNFKGFFLFFKYTKSRIGAYIGEVFGTGILGGMLCYPIASMMMGQKAALFTFVGPILDFVYLKTIALINAPTILPGNASKLPVPRRFRISAVQNAIDTP